MDPFSRLIEQRLQRAEENGAFRNLAGAGKPLELEDLSGVPEELRSGYLLLKSNGFVPPELEARKEWLRLQDLLAACIAPEERGRLSAEVGRARDRYQQLIAERSPRLSAFRALSEHDA